MGKARFENNCFLTATLCTILSTNTGNDLIVIVQVTGGITGLFRPQLSSHIFIYIWGEYMYYTCSEFVDWLNSTHSSWVNPFYWIIATDKYQVCPWFFFKKLLYHYQVCLFHPFPGMSQIWPKFCYYFAIQMSEKTGEGGLFVNMGFYF